MASISTHSALIIQQFFQNFHSRRLMQTASMVSSPPLPSHENPSKHRESNTMDANVVMVLSVLLCALICSLGLNSIIRCALRCSNSPASSDDVAADHGSARLANTGVKKKALKAFPTVSYSDGLNLPGLDTECAICLSDFATGERVRVLPKCNHGFHVRCIDKWLNSHSSCPTCRHCLVETCHKIVAGCSPEAAGAASRSMVYSTPEAQPAREEVVVRIDPLQREDSVRNHET